MFSISGTKLKVGRLILLSIPLILSCFTHLWNAAQFPSFHVDEGTYLRRALYIASGLGLQDPSSRFDHTQDSTSAYDHPYFGPLFLAAIFKIIGYPESLNPSSDTNSIESLFAVPRIMMGILAVVDTFLIFRICERRYSFAIGLFASLLFAVMPLNWYTRRIVLDSIMLPFILTSILLVLEVHARQKYTQLLLVLSGISLGLAIFTKTIAITMFTLIIFLIFQNIHKPLKISRSKILTLWIIPVFLIPAIWPFYAFVAGDLEEWFSGVFWQAAGRQTEGRLLDTASGSFRTDPILLILGTAGVIYLTVKRDYLAAFWVVPFAVLILLVGWAIHFYLILIIPILCISSAKMIYDIPNIIGQRKSNIVISSIVMSGIVLFGIISTTILVSTDLSYIQVKTASYVSSEIIPKDRNSALAKNNNNVTIISGPVFSWLWKYVYNNNNSFSHIRDTEPVKTNKVLLVEDYSLRHLLSNPLRENKTQIDRLNLLYNHTDIVAIFRELPSEYMDKNYPFAGINSAKSGSLTTEIRTNY